MTAKEKIEKLTNGWYGYTVFWGLVWLLMNGLGFLGLNLVFTIGSTVFSLFITFLLGRALLRRSGSTRVILTILSALGVMFGLLGTVSVLWKFLGDWSLTLLVYAAMMGGNVMMNARSFRVLTDKSVKAYIAG
jgi:hypothetical protein